MRRVAVVSALLCAGCVGQTIEPPSEAGHDDAEVRATSEQMTQWRVDGDWALAPELSTVDGVSRVGVLVGLTAPGAMPRISAIRSRIDCL